MKRNFCFVMLLTIVLLLGVGTIYAQSSGNFSAAGTPASCKIGIDGSLSGGKTGSTFFVANISTPSGNGTTLDIRPSFVTGLFTDTKISTTIPSATADVGIQVCVTVDGKGNDQGAGIKPTDCVVYDQRFQQISSNLFSQLTACTLAPTTTACTTDGDCASLGTGFSCDLTSLVCVGPNPLCDFDLILSTLSAHSFDFVVPVSNGKPHTIKASWSVIGSGASVASAHVDSCVGPGIVTVEQVKVFQNSGSLSF